MSAYVVEREHIKYLVEEAVWFARRRNYGRFRWRRPDGQSCGRIESFNDEETLAAAANMLLQECVASVSYRYPEDTLDMLPGTVGEVEYVWGAEDFHRNPMAVTDKPNMAQLAHSISCYEYQSCEHPGWLHSEAREFCHALREAILDDLPGREDATWGAPQIASR